MGQKTTHDGMQNRTPKETHVQALVANFGVIRHHRLSDQLVVAMSKQDLEAAIQYTWDRLSEDQIFHGKFPDQAFHSTLAAEPSEEPLNVGESTLQTLTTGTMTKQAAGARRRRPRRKATRQPPHTSLTSMS